MATYRLTGPDGSTYNVTAPDSASQDEVLQTFHANMGTAPAPAAPQDYLGKLKANTAALGGEVRDVGLGALRGAGSIGNTLMSAASVPTDLMSGRMPSLDAWRQRGQDMTDATQSLGADPNSFGYRAGKLGGEIAGTAGTAGLLAKGAEGLGAAPEVVNALRTGGFTTGPTTLSPAGNLLLRTGAGATTGAATVGLADPEHAGTGALLGGALPGAVKLMEPVGSAAVDAAQSGARRLMESALKPTLKQKQTGEAATAVQTLLDYGINPTKGGVEKLNGLISDLNDQVSNKIAGSSATIDPQKVVNALAGTEKKFGNQVAPTADLNAIQGVKQDFLNNGGAGDIPVQLAQQLKQGTYATLKGKYGQMGSAETEANKGLALGLKNEIASAVPEVGPLNAEESRLISTLNVTERRAMMDVNKNPLGLAALAVHEPTAFLAFMADKSAAFKSLAARALNAASAKAPQLNALAGPLAFRALPGSAKQQP